jgi:hypothetical protein
VSAALLMLAGLVGAAHAQSFIQTEGTGCDENAVPIAGTTGFSNARHALRTTAQTYSATNYAEKHLLPRVPVKEEGGAFAMEFFQMIKAAEIASFESKSINYANGTSNDELTCPQNYRVSVRPVDLQAMAMGGAYKNKNFSVFYAASVAYGNPAMPNNAVRGMMLFGQPIYAMSTLFVAPLARNGFTTQQGASAFALDWVAGATYSVPAASVRAGYAGSRGMYAGATENKIGLFASGLLGGQDRGEGALGYLKAGLDRFDWKPIAGGIGLTSAYLRDLPYGVEVADTVQDDGGLVSDVGRLRTGHFEQDNIGGYVDVGGTWAAKPVSSLYDAGLAVHSKNYTPKRDVKQGKNKKKKGKKHKGGGGQPEDGFVWYAGGGVVDLPAQATLGIEGGRAFTGRLEGAMVFSDGGSGAHGRGSIALLVNDPEVLVLYPYAINSLTFRYSIEGQF